MTAIVYARHGRRALLLASLVIGANGSAQADAEKGSFKLPGSDTSVTLGGYVKLDAIWSDKSAGVDSVGDQQLNVHAPGVKAIIVGEDGQLHGYRTSRDSA